MKKLFCVLIITLLSIFGVVASADTANDFTTSAIYDFSNIEDGEHMLSTLEGFWLPPGVNDILVQINDGKITFFDMNIWGAFPSFNAEQQALTVNATGYGFYVKNNGDFEITLSMGFNAADSKNYVLADYAPYVLVDMQGNRTNEYTIWNGYNSQGGVIIPEGFEGYVYIPFSSYVFNDGSATGDAYEASIGMVTPIFALNDGETITYGEIYAFNSDDEFFNSTAPTQEPITAPTEEATDESSVAPTDGPTCITGPNCNGDQQASFPVWIIIAAVAVVAVVVIVIVLFKKKKD